MRVLDDINEHHSLPPDMYDEIKKHIQLAISSKLEIDLGHFK